MQSNILLIIFSAIAAFIAIYIKNFLPFFIEAQKKVVHLKISYKPNPWFVKYINYFLFTLFLLSPFIIKYFLGINVKTILLILFCWSLFLIATIDYLTLFIPDKLTLPMIWIGLVKEIFQQTQVVGIENALFGAIFGYLLLRIIGELFYLFKKKDAIGRGDMKLLAMVGSWLGYQSIAFIVVCASFFAFFLALYILIKNRKKKHFSINQYFPYGPFLCFSSLLYLILSISQS